MIGITGGIASGKSAVAGRLCSLGAVVLDADLIAREAVEPHTPGWAEVKKFFPEVIQGDLQINRRELGRIVFSDPGKRKVLEKIVHPLVRLGLEEEGARLAAKKKVVFAEVPLLYEVGWDEWIKPVWVVYVRPEVQLERLMARARISAEEALQMIASQMPLAEKVKRAQRIIDNNGSLVETWAQVDALWKELCVEDSPHCP